MIYKNTASQKLAVYAYTLSTGAPKTGDAAQITCYESIDWAAADQLDDASPTELDATNMKGWYLFDLTQAETNGEVLVFAPVSSTAGVALDQVQVVTQASVNQTGDAYARLGAPVGASVSADIAAIEAQTDDIGVAGAGLTALGDTRLANLDAAVSTRAATGAAMALTAAAVDAVWDELTAGHAVAGSTGKALSDAGAAGDPWAAATRTLTSSAAATLAAVTGSTITITRGDTASIALTGLGSLAGHAEIWLTVKKDEDDADADSILQIKHTSGLAYLNGAAPVAPVVAGDATLAVDDEVAGNITVAIAARATKDLPLDTYAYDVQWKDATGAIYTKTTGVFLVGKDFTRAVS